MCLSVCLIASAPAARVAALLQPVRELADEIVIAADSRGDARRLRRARGPVLPHRVPPTGCARAAPATSARATGSSCRSTSSRSTRTPTRTVAHAAFDRLLAGREAAVVTVDTRLGPAVSGRGLAAEVEALIGAADVAH